MFTIHILTPLRRSLAIMGVLLLLCLGSSSLATSGPAQAASGKEAPQAEPRRPNSCPAAPTNPNLPETIEGTFFCVYYNLNDTTPAQAQTAADAMVTNRTRFVTDFGFRTPFIRGYKLQVYITQGFECNGATDDPNDIIFLRMPCFNFSWMMPEMLGHELFHRIQFSYDYEDERFLEEGTARAMQDSTLAANDDNPDEQLLPYSFLRQARAYLLDPNIDITEFAHKYSSALFWKYFQERYGFMHTEPGYGVDAIRRLWEAIANYNGITAINQALISLGSSDNFNAAFRRFARASYTHRLHNLPDESFTFHDEFTPGSPPSYGDVRTTDLGLLSPSAPLNSDPQTLKPYGAVYISASPSTDCPLGMVSVYLDGTSSGRLPGWYVVTEQNGNLIEQAEGRNLGQYVSFANDDLTRITAIFASQGITSTVSVQMACMGLEMHIVYPTSSAQVLVGSNLLPWEFTARVRVVDPDMEDSSIQGLRREQFRARINGRDTPVVSAIYQDGIYRLILRTPVQVNPGTYPLTLEVFSPSSGRVLATATNPSSVVYSSERSDYVLMVDRSTSMGAGSYTRLEALNGAVDLYLDLARDGEGMAIVPFNADVSDPPLFSLQTLNATTRQLAKNFLDSLTTGEGSSFGDPLAAAVTQRNGSATGNPRCAFTLISDGKDEDPAYWPDVQESVLATRCPVDTLALGADAGETYLSDISLFTGGMYLFSDVAAPTLRRMPEDISAERMALDFASALERIQGEQEHRGRLLRKVGTINANSTQQYSIQLDSTIIEAMFILDWLPDGAEDLGFELVRPDGQHITPGTLPYTFHDSTSLHSGWRILNPMPGKWWLMVHNSSSLPIERPYQVLVSARDSLGMSDPSRPVATGTLRTGMKFPFNLIVMPEEPKLDWHIKVNVTDPAGWVSIFPLLDDGRHGDGMVGDGVFGNYFLRLNQVVPALLDTTPVEQATQAEGDEGSYQYVITATNGDIQREYYGSFVVVAGPDSDGDGMPDDFETTYGVDDPVGDPDRDFLTNLQEYQAGTDPTNPDTDEGGEDDGSEVNFGQNPLDPEDDMLPAMSFCAAQAGNGQVKVSYDIQNAYQDIWLYRASSPGGPWTLRATSLPLTGVYMDTADNDMTYFYSMQAMEAAMHWSAMCFTGAATPRQDPYPPEAAVIIDDGAAWAKMPWVKLSFAPYGEDASIDTFSDITLMMVSNDPDFSGAQWQPFAQEFPWTLLPARGGEFAFVYVRFKDAAGNESGLFVGTIRMPWMIHLPLVMRK